MSLSDVRPIFIDDVIKWEADNARDAVTFRNNTGAIADFTIGRTLVKSGSNYQPAELSDADCVLLTNIYDLAISGTIKVAVIGLRGNCTLNQDAMVYSNGGTDTDDVSQKAALVAQGVKLVSEPLTAKTSYGA